MRARWIIALAGLAIAAASIGGRSRAVRGDAPLFAPGPSSARSADLPLGPSAAPAGPRAVVARSGAADAPSADEAATTTLTGATLEPDLLARLGAIEAAVRDGDLSALPSLAGADLTREPEAAPSIIHAVAGLAAQGGKAEQELASKTLTRWLREESRRETRDASGNVVNLVEALGDLGGDGAVSALIETLDREGALDLALQTTTAQRLGALGDARALPAIERFAARVARLTPSDDAFERALLDEARTAAAEARALLGQR